MHSNNVSIEINMTDCKMIICDPDDKQAENYLFLIWELLAIYDGYFYKPKKRFLMAMKKMFQHYTEEVFNYGLIVISVSF